MTRGSETVGSRPLPSRPGRGMQGDETKRMTGKRFMMGLKPGPPPGYVSHDFEDFSVYTAEQPRSVWERHTHDCTQITVALSPARVRGEWMGTAGAIDRREMCGNEVWSVAPG